MATFEINNGIPNAENSIISGTLGSEVTRISSVAINDDPTESVYQGRITTTDATVTELHSYATTAGYTYGVSIDVIARRTGGTGVGNVGDSLYWKYAALFRNVSGVLTKVNETGYVYQYDEAWTVATAVSGTNIRTTVEGLANKNIVWHITARFYPIGS